MKLTVLCLCLGFVACQNDTVKQELGNVKQQAQESLQKIHQAYADELNTQIDGIQQEASKLQERVDALPAEAKARVEPHLKTVNEKLENLKAQARKTTTESGAAWDTLKTGLDAALADLRQAMKAATDEMSK